MKNRTAPERTARNTKHPLDMKETLPENIEFSESVKNDAERIAQDPDAMLRLVDLLFFLDDRPPIPS